ncbi:hypothetical protein ABT336_17725 [Micromonospora sp. NPDC000207]|uniref:hypothetical protein n=1 Tax=Micromonospora sp. NPDC000207 TaxID=3154246 RepID=UPI00331E7B7A
MSSQVEQRSGRAQHLVRTAAGRLDPHGAPMPQLRAAPGTDHEAVAAAVTSHPGLSSVLLRGTACRLLGLAEPDRRGKAGPPPPPAPPRHWGTTEE